MTLARRHKNTAQGKPGLEVGLDNMDNEGRARYVFKILNGHENTNPNIFFFMSGHAIERAE